MEGLQPPKISDETRSGFAAAVASQPEEGAGEVASETTSEPTGSPSPAPVTETENSGVTNSQEVTETTQPETGDEHSAESTEKGPIPYDRFREINEAKKRLEEENKVLRTRGADPAVIDQMAADRARAHLARIAAEHPELQKAIFGEQPAETPHSQQPQGLPPLDPKDPVQARVLAIEAAQRAASAELANRRRQDVINEMENRAEERMETHPIFKDADARSIGETLIAQKLIANPRTPVESVVDDVAKQLRSFREATKAGYVKPKTEAPKKIAPGAGGGAAPPGAPTGQKYSIKDGTARKGLEAAIRADMQQS